jgi:hypothetical protein
MTRAAEASIQAVSPVSIFGTIPPPERSGFVRLYGTEVSDPFHACFGRVNSTTAGAPTTA